MTRTVDLSIVTCCYKYVQRCREFLRSVARQDRVEGLRIEAVVTTPGNPDGVREYLGLASQSYGDLRIVRVDVPETMRRNRGWMIQRAVECGQGDSRAICCNAGSYALARVRWVRRLPCIAIQLQPPNRRDSLAMTHAAAFRDDLHESPRPAWARR